MTQAIDPPVSFKELDTLKGIDTTQSIQAQLDSKEGASLTNTHIFVGNSSNVPTDVALSGGATIANTGVLTLGGLKGYTTTATAGTTTTLDNTATVLQYFTGSTTQTVKLPVVSTLALGWQYQIVNTSTGAVTVQSSGANTIATVAPGTSVMFTCILITGTTAASWDASGNDADVTGALLTGFSSGAGTVASSDTILQAFNKLVGNTQNLTVLANLLTGFSSGAGTVSAADTILQGFNKLVGNTQNLSVIANLLTGYSSGAGTVSASDTILSAINKLNGNTAAQGLWTTFSPTVTVGGDTAPVYTTNTGRYATVGKTAFVEIYLTGDGGAEGSGTTQISVAIPVAAGASQPTGLFPAGYGLNNTLESILYGQIAGGASVMTLSYFNAIGTTASYTANSQNNSTRTIRLKFHYETA